MQTQNSKFKIQIVNCKMQNYTNIDFDLNGRIPYHLKIGFFISLTLFIMACLFIPQTNPKPYVKRTDIVVQTIELPPQLKQLENELPPPPKPEMPIAAESEEEIEKSTIDPTAGISFNKAPPTPEAPEIPVFDVNIVDEKPELLQKYFVPPEYPEVVRKVGITGQVVLELVVDTTGVVIETKIVKSLHEMLDESAVKAARKWRFKPGKQRGIPVRVRVVQPLNFRIEE